MKFKGPGEVLRVLLCCFFGCLIDIATAGPTPRKTGRSALVFAPHQDDETLGCGGTILKKKQVGTDVKIIFMTDGNMSGTRPELHGELLKEIRASEALAAASVLGLQQQEVLFLEYPDRGLHLHQPEAIEKIKAILDRERPQEVFMPHYKDGHGDHSATNRIVRAAILQSGRGVTVYEYPVWFWNHWPWVKMGTGIYGGMPMFKKSMSHFWPKLREFNCSVDVREFLPAKRAAYCRYESQKELNVFLDGTFIKQFFRGKEYFIRYELGSDVA